LGMIQSVARYLFLPLAVLGVLFSLRRDWRVSCVLLITILYYLVPGTVGHTEIRYVLPMHALLTVFAGSVFLKSPLLGNGASGTQKERGDFPAGGS
jgi:hypothetical protein